MTTYRGRSCLMFGLLTGLCWLSLGITRADERLAVPDEKTQRNIRRQLAEIFSEDYQRAASAAQKTSLAKKLFDVGVASDTDAAEAYVLLKISSDIAARSGDVKMTLRGIDRLTGRYRASAIDLKLPALTALADAAVSASDRRALVTAAWETIPEAISADRFDAARAVAKIGVATARKVKDLVAVKRIGAALQAMEPLEKEFVRVTLARAVLKENPNDPQAALTVGRYVCLIHGKWDEGLALLARSGDERYRKIAELELKRPNDPKELVALGDLWWSLAEAETGPFPSRLKQRAADWYRQARPELSGLSKKKVEVRLAKVAPRGKPAPGSIAKQEDPEPEAKAHQTYARISMPGVTAKRFLEGMAGWEDRFKFSNIPQPLRQGYLFLPGGNVKGNTTRFTVHVDGVVLMVLSGRPGGGGNGSEWKKTITSPTAMAAQGWKPVGKMDLGGHPPSVIYSRVCRKGESFVYSWEKYIPPGLIVPAR